MPDGGGGCDEQFEILAHSDARNGITPNDVLADFLGTESAPLEWVGTSTGSTSFEFKEKGTSADLMFTLAEPMVPEYRWFSGGGSGSTGCAPRLAVRVVLTLITSDGALNESATVWLERFAYPDLPEDEVQAAVLFTFPLEGLNGSLEIATEPDVELDGVSGVISFYVGGESHGRITTKAITGVGDAGVSGEQAELATW